MPSSRKERIPSTYNWTLSPSGQHLELGIAEMNLFIALSALRPLPFDLRRAAAPVGTLYFEIKVADNSGVTWTGTKKSDHKMGTVSQGRLDGGDGDDNIAAGAASDWIICGAGKDVITTGDSWDTLQFGPKSGKDVVTDFKLGVDRLYLLDQAKIVALQEIDTNEDFLADSTMVWFSRSDTVLLEGVTGATSALLLTPDWTLM